MKQYNFKEDPKKGLNNIFIKFIASIITIGALSSCGDDGLTHKVFEPYDGPMSIIENIELVFSDSAKTKVKLLAKKQLELSNGDRDFPEGIYIEFYNDQEVLETTLQANTGHFNSEENIYTGNGDVKIKNLIEVKSLFTEELLWNPKTEKIYTEKNVIIIQDGEKITGTGLTASQDFEDYEIKNPKGSFIINSEDEIN
jgi:LPS export ABC transporter protein LptC